MRAVPRCQRTLALPAAGGIGVRAPHGFQQFICFNFTLELYYHTVAAFSALTLLVGRQVEHPACKKLTDKVLVWLSV